MPPLTEEWHQRKDDLTDKASLGGKSLVPHEVGEIVGACVTAIVLYPQAPRADQTGNVIVTRLATRSRVAVFSVMGVLAVSAAVTALVPETGETLGFPLMLLGYLACGVMFYTGAASHDGRERTAWRLIGLAFLTGAAGILTFSLAVLSGYDLPAFGLLDVFFIVAYVSNLAGMWVLPHFEGVPMRRVRIFIDGLVGAISTAVVAWVWFLRDILAGISDATVTEVVIGSAYPLVDVATLIVVMVVTLRRSTLRFDPRVLLIGAGFVCQAVADIIYLRQGLGMTFASADPVYPLFLLALVFFLAAGLTIRARPTAREYAERRTPWWAMLAPYGAAVVLVGTLLARIVGEEMGLETVELFVGVVVVVTLIIARQAVAIRENRELVERQRAALVSSISHELRTPLTAMVGFLDLMTDPDQHIEQEARHDMLEIVDQQAKYMARIVSDLVMLNRSDPDLQLEVVGIDVAAAVGAAQVALDVDSAPGVDTDVTPGLMVHADSSRLQQVLVNLLTNAARYGGPRRLVVARRVEGDVVIEVHDNGEGVPRRYELVIWDRFERGAHRYDAGVPGSGIGLSIVTMLVGAHDGTVSYRRSERLGGACFTVTIPDVAPAVKVSFGGVATAPAGTRA